MKKRQTRRADGFGAGSLADLLKQTGRGNADVLSFAGDWPAAGPSLDGTMPDPSDTAPHSTTGESNAAAQAKSGTELTAASESNTESELTAASHSTSASLSADDSESAQGLLPLREQLCAYLAAQGIVADPSELLLTKGHAQTIAIIARTLHLRPGDAVLVANPTDAASLEAFRKLALRPVPVPSDEDGLRTAEAELLIERHRPKLVYAMPTLGVPASPTWSEARRTAWLELSRRHAVVIAEDNSYGALRFPGTAPAPPTLFELDARTGGGHVVSIGHFAALLGSARPAGWMVGSRGLIARLAETAMEARLGIAGDAADELRSQRELDRLLRPIGLHAHAHALRMSCADRMHHMQALLRRHRLDGVTWTEPEGGLFLWLELPEGLDAETLLRAAAAKQVAFDPGAPFYAADPQRNRVRLNAASMPVERMEEGIARFAEAVNEFLARSTS